MSNFELQEKAVKAATRFIERKGFELLDTGWTSPEGTQIDLNASDEDTLVFIDVTATEYGEGGFEGGKVKRSDLEIAAASWLAGNTPDGDIQVRFDIIDMLSFRFNLALSRVRWITKASRFALKGSRSGCALLGRTRPSSGRIPARWRRRRCSCPSWMYSG